MVSVKDFRVGQIAYEVLEEHGEKVVREYKVLKIGRKWVTISNGLRYEQHDKSYRCLSKDYEMIGGTRYLFKDKEAVNDYFEQIELERSLSNAFAYCGGRYTLEQLRRITEIIKEKDNEAHTDD